MIPYGGWITNPNPYKLENRKWIDTSIFTLILGKNLPDQYVYEGNMDAGLLDYLKELNSHDLCDIVDQAADKDKSTHTIHQSQMFSSSNTTLNWV